MTVLILPDEVRAHVEALEKRARDSEERCNEIADQTQLIIAERDKLRSEADKWEHRAGELAEERNQLRTQNEGLRDQVEKKGTALAVIEGAARRYLETIEEQPAPSRARLALEWALNQSAKALAR